MNTPIDPVDLDPASPSPEPRRPGRGLRRATAVGLAAGILGGGAAGLFMAVPSLTSAASDSATLQETGTDTGTETGTDRGADTDERPDRAARIRETLQSLVDDGTITAAQADAVAAHLDAQMPERGGRGHGRGMGGAVVADALGITVEELREALASGQSVADVAAAQGVDLQVVIDAMIAEADERLDAKVADGRLTQEEADARLTEMTERITERVNTPGLDHMGRHGRDGSADSADAGTTDAATDA